MTLATEWKFCSICFLSFICENTHKEFGIKTLEIDMLMVFDLLTLPQGYQFDPRMKMLLAFCSARHPRRFNMPHDHVWKFFLTPWAPQVPKSPTPGAWPRRQNKKPVWYVLYLICENTHKVWYKNLWNWHGNWNLMIFDLWPHPKVTSLTIGWKFYLHSVLLVILVDLICPMTMFENNFFDHPGHP